MNASIRSLWAVVVVGVVCLLAWGCDPGSFNHIRKGEITEVEWRQIAAPAAPAPPPVVEPPPVAPAEPEPPVDEAEAPPLEEGEGPRKVPAEPEEAAPEEADEAAPSDGADEPSAEPPPADALDVELEP